MKKSLFVIGMMTLATITTNTYANTNRMENHDLVNQQKEQQAKKIHISGNVEVTLVQDVESNKLYTLNNQVKAKVYEDENNIYVTCHKKGERAQITLYFSDITRIDISQDAIVKTKNTINTRYLQIILKDNAKAEINSRTESLYTNLSNESNLKLNGATRNHTISNNELATLDTTQLRSLKTEIEKRNSQDYSQM